MAFLAVHISAMEKKRKWLKSRFECPRVSELLAELLHLEAELRKGKQPGCGSGLRTKRRGRVLPKTPDSQPRCPNPSQDARILAGTLKSDPGGPFPSPDTEILASMHDS